MPKVSEPEIKRVKPASPGLPDSYSRAHLGRHTAAGDLIPSWRNGPQGPGEARFHSPSMICQGFMNECPHTGTFARPGRGGDSWAALQSL